MLRGLLTDATKISVSSILERCYSKGHTEVHDAKLLICNAGKCKQLGLYAVEEIKLYWKEATKPKYSKTHKTATEKKFRIVYSKTLRRRGIR